MHKQIRVKIPRQSPPSVATLLELLAAQGVNLKGVGGSNVEFDGEFAIAVDHDHETLAVGVLNNNNYEYREFEVGVNPELRQCHLTDEPGKLLACLQEIEQDNLANNRGIRDILIGVPNNQGIPVQIFSDGNADQQPVI